MLKITAIHETYPLKKAFGISRGSKTQADVVRVTLENMDTFGHGECVPYGRYGESVESVIAQIQALPDDFTRDELQVLMPAGAARNAVDCALWDLEAKQSNTPVWQLAGLDEPDIVTTAYTISLAQPSAMQEDAQKNAHRPLLKLKLGTPDDLPRLKAVREGAPNSEIIVDANEGWKLEELDALLPHLDEFGVSLIEQPLPEKNDDPIADYTGRIPICADESCHTTHGLDELKQKYQFINIKLDKTGGLTEAIKLKKSAEELGIGIFVGCMVGTSLSMAPALLLAQNAKYIDLDGPLLLAEDRSPGLQYDGSSIHPPSQDLWG